MDGEYGFYMQNCKEQGVIDGKLGLSTKWLGSYLGLELFFNKCFSTGVNSLIVNSLVGILR